EALEDIQKLSQEALAEMRAMIFQLRPIPKDHMLSREIVAYGKSLGVQVSISSRGEAFIPEAYRENLWRILQEAMNNISKHAKVTDAIVKMTANDQQISLQVIDQGVGFSIDNRNGDKKTFGLSSMRERVEEMGGTLTIDSGNNRGTTVSVTIPLGRR
ncbi:MAG TPA: ATP-binding protein, partial [Sporolactobacillaceae bacterium]|nr:ATP-binding protein [Sporolactobacillaceae bacterium]